MSDVTERPLLLALLLSALVHGTALLAVRVPHGHAVAPEAAPIEVALLSPEQAVAAPPAVPAPPRPQQMVAPPDEINDRPPDNPRFESDRDNTVLQETVRPGVPNPGPEGAPRKAAAVPPRPGTQGGSEERAAAPARKAAERGAPEDERRPHAPALEDLFASTDELVRAEHGERERAAEQAAERETTAQRRMALAVPPVTPEWSLPGTRGTYDYLPDIQRGNVTLLNTKANAFAPFVRRVGERVFQHLIIRQRSLELQQILSAHGPVQMRVLLDPAGKLKSVRVEGQSGSATMDDTLSEAVNTAAFDNNPPRAAANGDGNYEFVFQAQLRAFEPGPGGQPSRIESRLSVALL
jgi:TonB family protein